MAKGPWSVFEVQESSFSRLKQTLMQILCPVSLPFYWAVTVTEHTRLSTNALKRKLHESTLFCYSHVNQTKQYVQYVAAHTAAWYPVSHMCGSPKIFASCLVCCWMWVCLVAAFEKSLLLNHTSANTFQFHKQNGGGTWWRSWLRHCATTWKVMGSIPDGVIRIFHWHNPSDHTMALG